MIAALTVPAEPGQWLRVCRDLGNCVNVTNGDSRYHGVLVGADLLRSDAGPRLTIRLRLHPPDFAH